jgi:flavin reductase (DIM6/NTAB) family NADH-FMN oxidoreductase RutF
MKPIKHNLALEAVFGLLEPGPVVLLTTARAGRLNVMPMSWHMMMEFTPPLVGCIVSNRNFSFAALRATKECVINIPTVSLLKAAVGCGNTSGRSVDKFARFGLTPTPGQCVAAPLIAECPVSLECTVEDARLVDRYNLFVLRVLKAWRAPRPRRLQTFHHMGMGRFMIAGKIRVLRSNMK